MTAQKKKQTESKLTAYEEVDLYVSRLDGFSSWTQSKQVDYLAYYVSTKPRAVSFLAKDIEDCFSLLALRPYKRLSVYLSESVGKKDGKYVKTPDGYRLERSAFDNIRMIVESEPQRIQVSEELANLVPKIKDSQERAFLEEAIRCYRVEAFRGAIVMVWALTIDHLQRYVFSNKLNDFNVAVAGHSDKKMSPVIQYDDFSNFKESRLIELMRSANIISGDVRKILDEKLGVRNSAGHPSGITFKGHKTTEFALDLIENVLLKY